MTFASNFSFRPQAPAEKQQNFERKFKFRSILKSYFFKMYVRLDLRNVALLLYRNIKIYLNIKKIYVTRALKLRNLIEAMTDP